MTAARIHIAIAALFGACGIALWAAATHSGATSAVIGAQMLLMHAAAIPALTAVRKVDLAHDTITRHAISVLILGVALFSGDLIARGLGGTRLFPMASPIGGVMMMMSWVAIAIAAMIGSKR